MAQREGWSLFSHVYPYFIGEVKKWRWEVGWLSNLDRETVVASGVRPTEEEAEASAERAKGRAARSDSFELSTRRRQVVKN